MIAITSSRCGERKAPVQQTTMPGAWGERINRQVCADCWAAWVEEQTIVINHYGLKPYLSADRQRLYQLMAEFLKLRA